LSPAYINVYLPVEGLSPAYINVHLPVEGLSPAHINVHLPVEGLSPAPAERAASGLEVGGPTFSSCLGDVAVVAQSLHADAGWAAAVQCGSSMAHRGRCGWDVGWDGGQHGGRFDVGG